MVASNAHPSVRRAPNIRVSFDAQTENCQIVNAAVSGSASFSWECPIALDRAEGYELLYLELDSRRSEGRPAPGLLGRPENNDDGNVRGRQGASLRATAFLSASLSAPLPLPRPRAPPG